MKTIPDILNSIPKDLLVKRILENKVTQTSEDIEKLVRKNINKRITAKKTEIQNNLKGVSA